MKLRTKELLDYTLGGLLMALLKVPTYCLGLILRRNHELVLRGRVAFIKLAGGGSLVMAYPSLLGLRLAHRDCHFVLITTPSVAPFASLLQVFDRVHVVDDRNIVTLLHSGINALRETYKFDTIIDLEAYGRLTTIFSLFTFARNRVSFFLESAFWRRKISTHLIFFNRFSPTYRFYDQLCAIYNVPPATVEQCRVKLLGENGLTAASAHSASSPSSAPRRIGLGHACSALARERMLTAEQWVSFLGARYAPETPLELHFFGVASDLAAADDISQAVTAHFSNVSLVKHCGLALTESVRLICSMDEFWGIDSALIHLSRLLGIATTSFWGPTDPACRLRPIAGLKEVVFYEKIPCSPCVHVASMPPCRGNNLCMKNLTRAPADKVTNSPWLTH